mmetsp:Transcript_16933/g.22057  ORF Transcript_16933/g.22057 Transcript_16933/m.22057 type:complete len:95 (-) Transcript_16933:526-810(-)
MKIVLVVGSIFDVDACDMDFDDPIECQNGLTVTDETTFRRLEESAGYLRTEVERKVNRCVRMNDRWGLDLMQDSNGFVVSGNFYTVQKYGLIRG